MADEPILQQPATPEAAPTTDVDVLNAPEGEIEVQVVDDRPKEDQRPPASEEALAKVVPPEDEIAQYSAEVQQRIKKLGWGYNEERRQKEQALAREQAAFQYAESLRQQNEYLKRATVANHKFAADASLQSVDSRLAAAKDKLKAAHEAGKTDDIVSAQADIASAAAERMLIGRTPPITEASIPNVPVPHFEQFQDPAPDLRAQQWHQHNPWFGTNEKLSTYAIAVHKELMTNGVSPNSEEYYKALDKEMAQRFPETVQQASGSPAPQQPARRPTQQVVAPAVRINENGKQRTRVTLTPSQVDVARRLGVTNEQYARQVLMLEHSNV